MARDFLLEIGMEEIPAKFAPLALSQLQENGEKKLSELRLSYSGLKAYATPRRLALYISNLAEHQAELHAEVKGPAKKAAFDSEGNPTKALLGFARSQGVDISDLFEKEVNGVPYMYARKTDSGQATVELLPQFSLDMIQMLQFPKPMRWGNMDVRFARPIRWLVALYGQEVIPFEFVGLKTNRFSKGHRTLAKGPIEINDAREYVEKLRQGYVIVDQDERKALIWEQIQQLATEVNGCVKENEELLTEITHLVEYPTALIGEVDPRYMDLPKPVITTPMQEHQRYFPVQKTDGDDLLPFFITVRNGDKTAIEQVKAGNEKVLKARLEDAAFYYREDLKKPLEDYIQKLYKVVYHDKLGTVGQRVERIHDLSGLLTEFLALDAVTSMHVDRTSILAKADLATMMVYDFPELQGIMGAEYAKVAGEAPEVCTGILEHYQPRFAGDALPASTVGKVVSIADKMDAIVGAFGIGIQPTGSQDPYALRRQAQGIVNILIDAEWDLSINTLITGAHKFYVKAGIPLLPVDDIRSSLLDFFQQRTRFALQEQGFRYDIIDAVLSKEGDWPYRAFKRAQFLTERRVDENFTPYIQAYVRCYNLAKKQTSPYWDKRVLVDPSEIALLEMIEARKTAVHDLVVKLRFKEAYELASELIPAIDRLFDSVMIMVDDEALKNARLGLLGLCVEILSCVGDLSLLVS